VECYRGFQLVPIAKTNALSNWETHFCSHINGSTLNRARAIYTFVCAWKPADNVNFNFQGLPHKTNMELMTQVSEDTQGSFWRQSSSFWCPAGRVRSNRIFTLSVVAGRTRRRRNKSNRHGNILLILSQIEIWQRMLFLHWLAQIEIRR
jgi:hypothetical protein